VCGRGTAGPRGTRSLLLCGWAPSGRVAPDAAWWERVLPPPTAHARRLRLQGCGGSALYTSVGYRLAGAIPAYAKSADGALDPSAFYYRLLTEGGPS